MPKLYNNQAALVNVLVDGELKQVRPGKSIDIEDAKLAKKLVDQKTLFKSLPEGFDEAEFDQKVATPNSVDEYKIALEKAGVKYADDAKLADLKKLYEAQVKK